MWKKKKGKTDARPRKRRQGKRRRLKAIPRISNIKSIFKAVKNLLPGKRYLHPVTASYLPFEVRRDVEGGEKRSGPNRENAFVSRWRGKWASNLGVVDTHTHQGN